MPSQRAFSTTILPQEASLPAYKRIEADLRRRVETAQWKPGVMLPGRRELARDYGVDLMTLQRAIAPLLEDGTLVASGRRCTMVNSMGRDTATLTNEGSTTLNVGIVGPYVESSANLEPKHRYFQHAFLSAFESSITRGRQVNFQYVQVMDEGDIDGQDTLQVLSQLEAEGMDAVLVFLLDTPRGVDQVSQFALKSSLPVVIAAAECQETPVPLVYYDNFGAGYEAAKELLKVERGEIVVLSPFDTFWASQRIRGMAEAVRHAGLDAGVLRCIPGQPKSLTSLRRLDWRAEGRKLAGELLAMGTPPMAMLCINDLLAIGVLEEVRSRGLRIGQDIILVSFDDIPQAAAAGLSSMRIPLENMGREACALLLRRLEGDLGVAQIRLSSQLMHRATTGGQKES